MNNTHTTVSAFLISAALLFSACGGSTPDAGTPVSDDAPAVTETETPEATTQDGDDAVSYTHLTLPTIYSV